VDIIGLIVEYNPFHNGHLYQINKIKEMYPNSLIILVLNGCFTERGEISYLTKEQKTKISLINGINIVVELPVVYGTQASDIFAYHSIRILNQLHITKLVFGSESNDINKIKKLAELQNDINFDTLVKEELKKGVNYPTALAKALKNDDFDYLPNDLLAISYVKAINKINKNIEPVTILRTNSYHDTKSNDEIISAENILTKLLNNESVEKYTSASSYINIPNYDIYFKLLKSSILSNHHLNEILDANEGLDNRLIKNITKVNNLEDLINIIKTKRYTYNKINRLLVHILLGLTKSDNKSLEQDYIHLLGFDSFGKKYLNSLKETNFTPNKKSLVYKYELKASQLYDLINNTNTSEFEYKNQPIIKK
jgi:predicted nucleotidyltransferase